PPPAPGGPAVARHKGRLGAAPACDARARRSPGLPQGAVSSEPEPPGRGQAAGIHLAHFRKDKRGSSYFRASPGQLGADQKPQAEETQARGVSAHGGCDAAHALRREAGHPPRSGSLLPPAGPALGPLAAHRPPKRRAPAPVPDARWLSIPSPPHPPLPPSPVTPSALLHATTPSLARQNKKNPNGSE
ncbi:hypothetical protein GH733_008627, partial [Mirounga leonina]